MHLWPSPFPLNKNLFAKVCLEFCLVSEPLEELIFNKLVELYGIKRAFQDGRTTHMLVFDQTCLQNSKKLEQIKRFKSVPKVVHLLWLVESISNS
jgi:hypothetical protein